MSTRIARGFDLVPWVANLPAGENSDTKPSHVHCDTVIVGKLAHRLCRIFHINAHFVDKRANPVAVLARLVSRPTKYLKLIHNVWMQAYADT